MTRQFPESDWKVFRRLHTLALERFCARVLEEIKLATANCTSDYHKRYLEVFHLIMERNDSMADAFDDMRRSKAIILITNIMAAQLLTADEFLQFSPETRETVEGILDIRGK